MTKTSEMQGNIHVNTDGEPGKIVFGEDVGTLDFSTGQLVFKGNLSATCKILFEWLKPMIDAHIEEQKENGGA